MERESEKHQGICADAQKLQQSLGMTPSSFLEAARRPSGRAALAERSGSTPSLILRWANHTDFSRIFGIECPFAELLDAAGVDSIRELRNRNAENLAEKLARVNETRNLCRRQPSVELVEDWIEQAKRLAPVLEY